MKSKTDLRIHAKEIRKSLDIKAISENLVALIRQSDIYINAQNVMIFYPMLHEVDLRGLLNDKKRFFLPKVIGKELLVCPYTENLQKSEYNVMEPCSKPVDCSALDLVIVPALMVDRQGYRLGYGGGFYDRFLKTCDAKTLVALPKELFVDVLPKDDFDVKVDEIVIK